MNGEEFYKILCDLRTPMRLEIKTVDEDGFVRDIVSADVDPETGHLLLRLEIQKKNGELE
jgi:hypothetical protein